jgi:hypothetical protein
VSSQGSSDTSTRQLQADSGESFAATEPVKTPQQPRHQQVASVKPAAEPHVPAIGQLSEHANRARPAGGTSCIKRGDLGAVRVPGLCKGGCEPWWGKCGGECYLGLGCCAEGSECRDAWGHGKICVPRATVTDCSEGTGPQGCALPYCRCKGSSHRGKGPSCCATGTRCTRVTSNYSYCKPLCALAS